MTEGLYSAKIKPEHLARKAIVYLRQSSDRQVTYNKESQILQYAMTERVRALGWRQVETINSDLGSSAGIASAQREGFERVISQVALGEVGIVGSREVSRLSRTDKDWCRLLEVCQIFGTLIADEQQVYDLSYLDDQLVLGIKGTLSVVELKVIRQRLLAGQESKARRGEMFKRLPVGYVQRRWNEKLDEVVTFIEVRDFGFIAVRVGVLLIVRWGWCCGCRSALGRATRLSCYLCW